MALFINYHPAYGSWLSKIIVLEFEDVEGLPLEIDSPPFNDGFIKARIFWMPWGRQGYAIRLVMEYDPSVSNETVMEYASVVSEEVMELINQTSLPIFFKKVYKDNSTNTLVAIIDHGYLPEALDSLRGLLKYRPREGFADLITDDFLRNYIPGEYYDSTGVHGQWLTELEYTLRKTNDSYRWAFKLSFSVQTALKNGEWTEILNLNSLLLSNDSINPSTQRNSTIIVQMLKYHRIRQETYEVSFESVYPPQTVREENDWILVTYQVTAPIDNVVATIKVSKLKPSLEWDEIIAIIFIVATLAIIVTFFIKKKRKGVKKLEENANNRSGIDIHRCLSNVSWNIITLRSCFFKSFQILKFSTQLFNFLLQLSFFFAGIVNPLLRS